jgi:ParB/RepB/Spo0J family partition protein
VEFKKIPLENIKRRYLPVQKELVEEFPDDLISSIKTLGLIQPIAVCKNSEQEYDVIDGNRRLGAYRELNRKYPGDETLKEIECVIHTKNEDEFEKEKIINTSMRVGTTPLSNSDISRSIDRLWKNYSDIKLFERKFGISKHIVRKYGAHLLLPIFLKDAINDGSIDNNVRIATDIAIKCVHALNWTADNDVSDEKVLELVKEYAKLTITRSRDIF